MNTNDPTLNVNLLLEELEDTVELTAKNARHMNDREVASGLVGVQKRFVMLMKKEIQPSAMSIRILKDEEDCENKQE